MGSLLSGVSRGPSGQRVCGRSCCDCGADGSCASDTPSKLKKTGSCLTSSGVFTPCSGLVASGIYSFMPKLKKTLLNGPKVWANSCIVVFSFLVSVVPVAVVVFSIAKSGDS